jgi:divinyl chlorophyllide a 8-vinyl-reductase
MIKTSPRVLLFGATGTIGKTVLAELQHRQCSVTVAVRPGSKLNGEIRYVDVTDANSVLANGFRHETFDAVISCLASRSGLTADAWAIDHQAHLNILKGAFATKTPHFIFLSAICVQKPKLAFQHAKLAFEAALISSGLIYSIIRPTAYFKSLSGQVARVKAGKPYLIFGNGELTACKPISDGDLARFMVNCLDDTSKHNAILPIGGPGPAETPKQQGEQLFQLLGQKPRFRHVPVRMLDAIIAALSAGGRMFPRFAAKAELARIGRYYATESMLVWDNAQQRYDTDATPSFGEERLKDYHARLIAGETVLDLREHAVF